MVNTIQADYAELENVAQQFEMLSDRVLAVYHELSNARIDMRWEWEGFGAEAFFLEMDQTILPALSKLHAALAGTSHAFSFIRSELENAELRYIYDGLGDFLPNLTGIGNVLGAISEWDGIIAPLIKAIQNGDDILGLLDFRSIGQIFTKFGDDIADLFNFGDNILGNTGTILGIVGAVAEIFTEYEGDSSGEFGKHVSAETIEFAMETAIRIAMYSNPVTGTAMAIYDIVNLWAAIDDDVGEMLGIDIPDLEIPPLADIDYLTDKAGDTIVEWVTGWFD